MVEFSEAALHGVSRMMKHVVPCLFVAALTISFAGCAARTTPAPAGRPEAAVPVPRAAVPPPPATQTIQEPLSPPPPAPRADAPASIPPVAPAPAPVDFPAKRVAGYLPAGCIVTEISDRELVVKRSKATRAPSLYEESIALSRLRGQLKSRVTIPTGTAAQSSLKDGTASIVFTAPLPPAEAAGAISSALSLDAVQKVRAVLAP